MKMLQYMNGYTYTRHDKIKIEIIKKKIVVDFIMTFQLKNQGFP